MHYRTLVTGSNGLIGSRLLDKSGNCNLIAIDARQSHINWPKFDDNCHIILIHLAWKSIPGLPDHQCFDISNGDKKMSITTFKSFCEAYKSCSIIFISTAGDMYRKISPLLTTESSPLTPRTHYSKSKMEMENFLAGMPINTVSLRISNAWGAKVNSNRRNGFIDKAIFNAKFSEEPTLVTPSLSSTLSIIHVDDICTALHLMCDVLTTKARIYNGIYYKQIFNLSSEVITLSKIIHNLQESINARFTFNNQENKPYFVMVDSNKIYHELNWRPRIFLNSKRIKETLQQYNSIE